MATTKKAKKAKKAVKKAGKKCGCRGGKCAPVAEATPAEATPTEVAEAVETK
jgi:hypothetical protein